MVTGKGEGVSKYDKGRRQGGREEGMEGWREESQEEEEEEKRRGRGGKEKERNDDRDVRASCYVGGSDRVRQGDKK